MEQDENLYVSHDPRPSQFDFDLYPGDLLGNKSPGSTNQSSRTCQPPPPCPGSQESSGNDSGIKDASPLIDQISQLLQHRLAPLEHKIDVLNETVAKLNTDINRLENAPVLCSQCRIFETKTSNSFENNDDPHYVQYNSQPRTTNDKDQWVNSVEAAGGISDESVRHRSTNTYENVEIKYKSLPVKPCRTKESAYFKMTGGGSKAFSNIGYGELPKSGDQTANKPFCETPNRSPIQDNRNKNQSFHGISSKSETRDKVSDKGDKTGLHNGSRIVFDKSSHIQHEMRKINNPCGLELKNRLCTNNEMCQRDQVTSSSEGKSSKIVHGSQHEAEKRDTEAETDQQQTSHDKEKSKVKEKQDDVPSEHNSIQRKLVKQSTEYENQEAYIDRRMSLPTYCGKTDRHQPSPSVDLKAYTNTGNRNFSSRHSLHTNIPSQNSPQFIKRADPNEYCKLRLDSGTHENKTNETKSEQRSMTEAEGNVSHDRNRHKVSGYSFGKDKAAKSEQNDPSGKVDCIYSEVQLRGEKTRPAVIEFYLSNSDDEQSIKAAGDSPKRKGNGSNMSPLKCALCNMMLGVDIKHITDQLWSEGLVSDSVYNQVTFSGPKIGEVDELWDRLIDELNHLEESRSDAAFQIVDKFLSDKHPTIAPELKRLYTLHDHRFKCRCKPRTYTV